MQRPAHPTVRDAVFWFEPLAPPLSPLRGSAHCDVVVVGGGMMGLMCARKLAAAGADVCVVEQDTCGSGASGRSSGFITPDSELEYAALENRFGAAAARQLWTFALSGIEGILRAITGEQIACDFERQDALFVAHRRSAADTIEHEHEARSAAGFASELVPAEELPQILGATDYFAGLRFSGTFGMNAYRFLVGLRQCLLGRGVRIYEGSRVRRLNPDGVETDRGRINANHVVVCTDRFAPELGLARRRVYHAQTFLGITTPLPASTLSLMFPSGPLMVWDTGLVYHYFRVAAGGRLLVGGSTVPSTYARHETHHPNSVAAAHQEYLRRHFPGLQVNFEAVWPGLIGVTRDFAPIVGYHRQHRAVRFAVGAAGLPWAAALGEYLADGILRGRNELDERLRLDRDFPLEWPLSVLPQQAAFAMAHGVAKVAYG